MDFAKAKSYFETGNDSAFYYFNKVTTSNKDSLTVAKSYHYMSSIQSDAGDYFGSQESVMRSMSFLNEAKKSNLSCISANYNELGYTSDNLKNYNLAIDYYDRAIQFSSDASNNGTMKNNKALAYQKLGKYDEALEIFNQIKIDRTKDPYTYARLMSNIARTKWLKDSSYVASSDLLKALYIGRENEWNMNLSYSYLSDYYANTKPDSALYFAGKMYQIAKKLNSADDQMEALQKLIKLSQPKNVKNYFSIYQRLADSVQTARNAAKNQFALIRYESEKRKADNLKLQKENTEKRHQIIQREILLVSSVAFFGLLGIIAFISFKKKKQKMEHEKEDAIKENRLRTSKKVHDVVANGLYRVMSEMENQPDIDRELIIDKIEDLYEKSRDISYDQPLQTDQNFQQKLSALLSAFTTSERKIIIVGNTSTLWDNVSNTKLYEVEHILQELMVNMKKHSEATTVVLKFENKQNSIFITYTDDGKGMLPHTHFNNGLTNTGNRINAIDGSVIFDTKLDKGLKIHITFPVS